MFFLSAKSRLFVLLCFVVFLGNGICATPPTQSKWKLWTGKTTLRGVNIWQKRVALEDHDTFGTAKLGPPYSSQSFLQLRRLGANFVDISHPGIFSQTPPYQLVPENLANLETLVSQIKACGCYVVISYRTGPGRDELGFDISKRSHSVNSVWTQEAAQKGWEQMWRFTASHFKSEPAVVGYDLMVEPNSDDIFFNGEGPQVFRTKHSGSSFDWNILAKRLTTAIREVDKTTPIIVGGMGYSSIDWLENLRLTDDTKTIYAVHQYSPFEYTNQPPQSKIGYPTKKVGEVGPFDSAWLAHQIFLITQFQTKINKPIVINEYGVTRWAPNATSFLRDEMDHFEKARFNYAIWLWESDWPKLGYDEFNFRFGPDPKRHSDLTNNPLLELLKSYWSRNTQRPE